MDRHGINTHLRAMQLLVLAAAVLLVACNADDTAPTQEHPDNAAAPQIIAGVQSFATGQAPVELVPGGNDTIASVRVRDAAGTTIPDALVTVNGTALQFLAETGAHYGHLVVPPGADIQVQVHVAGKSYALVGQHLGGFPELLTPGSDALWSSAAINTVTWQNSSTVPTTSQTLSVLGSLPQLPQTQPPFSLTFNLPAALNSFAFPANQLPTGNYLLVLSVSRTVPMPEAHTGSALILSAATHRRVSVDTTRNLRQAPPTLGEARR